jgi:xylan 1,4-beta-xylosidase
MGCFVLNRCHALFLVTLWTVLLSLSSSAQTPGNDDTQTILLDLKAPTKAFPHFWEVMFGSGRAILALRENYRHDLETVKKATGFGYIRFHGIFDDDLGVYDEDAEGRPVYNFSYVDQVYDGLLAHHVRPFVELGFMPKKLAATSVLHPFWYKPSPSPPKDYAKWDALITAFAAHLLDRYGIEEVSQWYFEVWNEPNIDFWAGEPKQPTYFELYDHTVRVLKKVNSRLRVGGPSTAQAAWVDSFIRHTAEANIPVDFVSTHVYANDTSKDVFGTMETIPRSLMVCRAVKKVHDQITASAKPSLPLIWSEYNASYMNEVDVTDTTFMAPWLADTIRQCDGLVDVMSYWSFSDVFDEQGVVKSPFYGGFGVMANGGIPKPAYNAFQLLHRLGSRRVETSLQSALITRRDDGAWALALWNLAPLGSPSTTRRFVVKIPAGMHSRELLLWRVDDEDGNVLPSFKQMGSPKYPTQTELEKLIQAGQLPAAQRLEVKDGAVTLEVKSQGLALLEIR